MNLENEVVTAPVDTQENSKIDTIEVETNIEAPEQGTQDSQEAEPKEAPQKTVNPRTQARKAEKERLISELATEREKNRQLEERYKTSKPEEPKKKDLSQEPKIEDYDDVIEFTKDLSKYQLTHELSERDKVAAEAKKQEYVAAYTEKLAPVIAEEPDFGQKINSLYDAGLIPEHIETTILKAHDSVDLTRHFVKYPGDLKMLNDMRPEALPGALKQIREFMKKPQSEEKPRVTQASPPISPPGNSAKTNRSINSYTQEEIENMPLSEYTKLTNR